MPLISPKITDVIEFVLEAHKGQVRESTGKTFLRHPLSVGYILQSCGYSEDVVIAGILHDVIEDTSFTEKDIREKFGPRIAELVAGVTEDKTIESWDERKQKYLDHLRTMNDEVKAISAADMLDNRRAVLAALDSGYDAWSKFKVSPRQIIENANARLAIVQESFNNEITEELREILTVLEKRI